MFRLGDKLGKSMAEIGEMSNAEYMAWAVYYARQAQKQELAQKMAKYGG